METPICQALLLCEQVIKDEQTKRNTLVNVLSHVTVPRAPVQLGRIALFAMLTNGNGDMEIDVRCSKTDSDLVIFATKGPVVFPSPHAVLEIVFQLNGMPIPEGGLYSFTVTCDDEIIAEARFGVNVVPPRTSNA